jgi:succinyl-diaminopimelate desuccinylase
MLETLQTLVEFRPVTSDQAAVQRLLKYVLYFLQQHGWQGWTIKRQGIYSLFASTDGSKHAKVLLQGHVDVVPGGPPHFALKNGRCHGRGVQDMLFATAAYLRLVDELGADSRDYSLAIMLTGDEEVGGLHGTRALLADGYGGEICILPDAGEGWGDLSVSAKGVLQAAVNIKGRSHHASQPWDGDGAARKLVHFLAELAAKYDNSERADTTLTISRLQAGEANNQGPERASAVLDVRYPPSRQLDDIKADLSDLAAAHGGRLSELMRGAATQLDMKHPAVKRFLRIYRRHAGEVSTSQAYGSSDARFFVEYGVPVLMFRPDGGGLHSDNEWLSVKSLEEFYQVLKEFALSEAAVARKS